MGSLALIVALLAQAAEMRSVSFVVTGERGAAIEGLVEQEVALLENGVARDITGLEADRRPLALVLLVDSSAAMGSALRLSVADAVVAFLRRLPEGTRYTLWTTGDRPARLVAFTSDPMEAAQAFRRVAPQGGNTLLDGLVEASEELRKVEGERTAVVAVSATGVEFSSRERTRVVEEARKNADVFLSVLIEEGETSFDNRASYDFALGQLAARSGGLHETVLTSMGTATALERLSAHLRGAYRLSYATLPDLKSRKIEVKVARPGVRVRVAPESLQEP